MSRSDTTEQLKNPAKFFLQWDGTKGGFNYFDKTKGQKVHIPIPLSFMVLDTLATIKGFSDKEQSGFWSNEIRTKDIKKETLVVRIKDKSDPTGRKIKIAAKGLYNDVTANKNCVGAKYCQSVYIAFQHEGEYVMANIQMMGAALSSWIEFGKTTEILKGTISISEMKEGKKGATKYKIPVFQKVESEPGSEEKATEIDKALKGYLEAYFEKQKELNKEEVASEQ